MFAMDLDGNQRHFMESEYNLWCRMGQENKLLGEIIAKISTGSLESPKNHKIL